MKLTVYHLKTCDSCRKALKALTAAGHDITAIDVRADGMSQAELKAAIDALGWEAVLNTRSTTWRGLEDADKAGMDAGKALALMGAHPTLIKRPVINDAQARWSVGWKKEQQALWL